MTKDKKPMRASEIASKSERLLRSLNIKLRFSERRGPHHCSGTNPCKAKQQPINIDPHAKHRLPGQAIATRGEAPNPRCSTKLSNKTFEVLRTSAPLTANVFHYMSRPNSRLFSNAGCWLTDSSASSARIASSFALSPLAARSGGSAQVAGPGEWPKRLST